MSETRKAIWVSPELHKVIKSEATKNHRTITGELSARFKK